MAYDCRVYRILIASPSDVEEERDIAVKVIQEWNDLYSYSRKVALLPLRWETHTAPEYGTRPQEVINRAIVDECDLLVGIFWTRIGSPTGAADSGTLEEIERVGKAGKPIMLYFSRVEIDPEKIEVEQIEKLKQFKDKSYPKGLIENYRKIIEFRDKFAKQLELKIRDIQRSDASGATPLSLEFLSIEQGEPIGTSLRRSFEFPSVIGYDAVPPEKQDKIRELVAAKIKQKLSVPIPLVIENSSASGVRNLYVELKCASTSEKLEIRDAAFSNTEWSASFMRWVSFPRWNDFFESNDVTGNLAKFTEETLQKIDQGWRVSFEWEALQPQRTRLIKPVLYIFTPESAKVTISAKVFADTFPEPFVLEASVSLDVQQTTAKLDDLLPNWNDLLEREEKSLRLAG
jgi:hypothetical protein